MIFMHSTYFILCKTGPMLTVYMYGGEPKPFHILPSLYLSGNRAAAAPLSGSGEQDVIHL